jgi:CRP/FNR family transcriptional regulator
MRKTPVFVDCQDCSLDPICHPAFIADSPFGNTDFNYVLNNMERRKAIPAGTLVYRQGDPVNAIHAVTSGAFKLVRTDDTHHNQLNGFRFPGELLGDEALAVQTYPLSAVALSESSVCVIPMEIIRNIGQAVPAFQQAFLTLIIQQCHLAHQQFSDYVALKTADQKLAAFLLHLNKRNIRLNHEPDSILLQMSRTDIAAYLGLRHETLSRTLGKFQQQDLILLKGKQIHLLKRPQLISIASGHEHSTYHDISA